MTGLVLILIAGAAGLWGETVTIPEQDRASLIHFSHESHLVNYGALCKDCHVKASESTAASDNILPKEAQCATCHPQAVDDPEMCGKCHKSEDARIPFESPERLIDFTHRYHTRTLDMGCETCHTGMAETDYASRKHWPVMDDCLTCHQDRDAPFDCATCHPKVEAILPRSHQQDWIHEHEHDVRSKDMPCASCHDDAYCEDCHAGALLVATRAPTDRIVEGAPTDRGRDPQIVQRQHDLTYRFTHPLDAVGQERQCQTCHEPEYCVDCHRVEGNESRFKPVWHGPVPGEMEPWVLGGVGSGGGRHGRWARNDIERCASCHDVEGGDPSCVQCHTDPDGVRGTDPRTHPAGFAGHAGEGDFHDNPGSLCYACHVNTESAGTGFCGYCHL